MVTPEQIAELPRKYAIGKRPLSRILGWGELTYTRLLEGAKPTAQHADELQKVLDEPLTYLMLLDQAHDSGLVSDVSYERSAKAAKSYLEEDNRAEGAIRSNAAARYLCILAGGDITPHALQLLAYYAHGHSVVQLPQPLMHEQPVAADNGPAYEAIGGWFTYERIQEAGSLAKDAVDAVLGAEETSLLESVFDRYGVYSATKLQDMACSEGPWRKARKRAAEAGGSSERAVITEKSMKKFFSKAAK